jgi:hypothetical protein
MLRAYQLSRKPLRVRQAEDYEAFEFEKERSPRLSSTSAQLAQTPPSWLLDSSSSADY